MFNILKILSKTLFFVDQNIIRNNRLCVDIEYYSYLGTILKTLIFVDRRVESSNEKLSFEQRKFLLCDLNEILLSKNKVVLTPVHTKLNLYYLNLNILFYIENERSEKKL